MEGVVLNRVGISGLFVVNRARGLDPQRHPYTQTSVKCPPTPPPRGPSGAKQAGKGNAGGREARGPRATQKLLVGTPRGEGLPYESDGDARRKIKIYTLKETNLGVAPALFNP